MELLCRKLNPNDQHFERLVAQEHAEQSLFFEDAIYEMDADARYQTTAAITPPEYNASNVILKPAELVHCDRGLVVRAWNKFVLGL